MSSADTTLQVDQLVVVDHRGRRLLDGVTLRIGAGEIVGLSGASGSGKSLLAAAIIGLLPPSATRVAGSIRFRGLEVERLAAQARHRLRGRGMSMMVQDAQSSLDPLRRIGAQLEEMLQLAAGLDTAQARQAADAWLERVGLPVAMRGRYPHQLSGGQSQRLVLALAAAASPALLLADEPTSALDGANASRVMELLRALAREQGSSVLLASHDAAVLRRTDRVVTIAGGRVQTADLSLARALPPPLPPQPGAPALRFVGVRHVYGSARDAGPALDRVSFSLAAGETLALLGESGSGKSTAARLAAGLLRPSAGSVLRVPAAGQAPAAMVFQDAREAFDPLWPVSRSIAEPLRHAGSRAARACGLTGWLARVGLSAEVASRLPDALSGGELQRAAIARALAGRPALLVCDEPTSALDIAARQAILALLRDLQREFRFAMLFVTHDVDAARAVAHRAAILARGCLIGEGPAAEVLALDPA